MSWLLALAAGLAGALLVYLASPRQNWRVVPSAWQWRAAGLALVAVSLLAWCRAAGSVAGVAAALTTLMLAWVLAPYIGWWLARRQQRGARR